MTGKKYKKYVPVEVHVKPITGAIGTTIQPGDQVMMVRSGYGSHAVCDKGTYLGYIVSKPTGNRRARVEMEEQYSSWCHADGREFNWKTDYRSDTWDEMKASLHVETRTRKVIVTLFLNRIAAIK